MIIPNQMITIKWVWQTRDHYESLGYIFTKYFDEFEVPTEHLTESSNYKVKIQCDYCEKICEQRYTDYVKGLKIIEKSCCNDAKCMNKKREESLLKTYKVSQTMYIPGIQEKIEETMMERYGVKRPIENKEILEKMHKTNIEKYGEANPMQVKRFKEKQKNTFFKNYRVKNPTQHQ